jgi:hypothetical protein
MSKIYDLDKNEWEGRLKSKPTVIKELATKFPPNKLFLMNNKHRVFIKFYSEDGTVAVGITGEYNAVMFDRTVFDVNPDDLKETAPPSDDEPLGTVFTEKKDVDSYLNALKRGL